MSMEYAVMAETHEGKTMTLRRGFSYKCVATWLEVSTEH